MKQFHCAAYCVPVAVMASLLVVGLGGCSAAFTDPVAPVTHGLALNGGVHGGQQPVAGARVYLYAAGTGGNGTDSRSMLAAPGYVLSGPQGQFSITGDYQCQPGDMVYVLARGGNPGLAAGTNNDAIALETGLGDCSALTPTTHIQVNEVTTVATVYALNGFESGVARIASNNTDASKLGLRNAFGMISNLVDTGTGLTRTDIGGAPNSVPRAEINSLANSMAACVNSDGTGTPCDSFFAATTTSLFPPTDTVSAMVAIANSPANHVDDIFNLSTSNAPFQPALTVAPNDWTVAVLFVGKGYFYPTCVAIDSQGNAWLATGDNNFGKVFELSPNGTQISPLGGYLGGGLLVSTSITIDPADNVWVSNKTQDYFNPNAQGSVTKLSNAGVPLSPSSGFSGGGLTRPGDIAIDGTGAVWVTDEAKGEVKLDNNGNVLSDANGFNHGGNFYGMVAIDPSNNFWAPNRFSDSVAELSSSGGVVSYQYATDASSFGAEAVAFNHDGDAWVVGSSKLTELSPTGQQLTLPGGASGGGLGGGTSSYGSPSRIAIDGAGSVFVINPGNVLGNPSIKPNLAVFTAYGGAVSLSAGFKTSLFAEPNSVAVDGSGNVWIADQGYGAIVFVGLATPVVTPLSLGIKNGTLASAP